jgi:hypothetical protein
MKYRRILLLAIALAALAAVSLEFGGGANVARSAPDTDVADISLDDVTILGADIDGDENTIEMPMSGNQLNIPTNLHSARIVKEITITVSIATTVRVSGEFVPPNYTVWHCVAPFVAGTDALSDQGCTVGSPDPHYTVFSGTFRGLPLCQWNSTTEDGTAPKVVMPWAALPYFKCERFVDESTLVAVDPSFQAGGGAAGCRVNEVTPAVWSPAPNPNPYNVGDCILDWHKHYDVTETGTVVLRVVDELELKPPGIPVGTYNMSEDIEIMPVGDTDPDLSDNTLTTSFELNMVPGGVGGLAELPDVSDSSGRNYVLLGGLAAAALVALGAGGWYARRRWVR